MARLLDRPGAMGRIAIADALELGASHAFQVKHDGALAVVRTDKRGQVVRVDGGRTGMPLTGGASELIGAYTGRPSALLAGEYTGHTEAGNRERAAIGFARVHLFDAIELGGKRIAHLAYEERHRLLCESAEMPVPWSLDATGRAHDEMSGRFRDGTLDARRFPVSPLIRDRAEIRRIWRDQVEIGEVEGLVCIALAAPLGARRSKIKIKPTADDLGCRVLRVENGAAQLEHGGRVFIVSARGAIGASLFPGAIVDVRHDGWTEAGSLPKFPRIARVRHDLMPVVTH